MSGESLNRQAVQQNANTAASYLRHSLTVFSSLYMIFPQFQSRGRIGIPVTNS